jgi:4-methyl-5(b-hydroxyethyl)-thiazole monophosphate biosynthesis
MGKVYAFFAEGFEEVEAITIVDILRRVGIETKMISISEEYLVEGSHNITVKTDKLFKEADFEDGDLLFYLEECRGNLICRITGH